ncbi:cation transporter [bacterium]|nr:cation transporter [bacterium]
MRPPVQEQKSIYQVTWIGMIVNISLAGIKFMVGWLVGSLALVADAIHSLSDLATDGLVLLGVKIGSKPADASHPFGHGKFETLMTLLIASVLIAAGLGIIWQAVLRFQSESGPPAGIWILLVAVLSVLLKEGSYQMTRLVAKKTGSMMLMANAWHHRTDALSSLAVLFGALAIMLGWPYGDQAAGMVVGLMVAYTGGEIAVKSMNELGEAGVDQKTREQIERILRAQPGVASWHRLRARRVGREINMDIHILVAPQLTIVEGHRIAQQVENVIREQIGAFVNIVVHIEPNLPEEIQEQDQY